MFKNPKNINQEMKFWGIAAWDGILFLGTPLVFFYFSQNLLLTGQMRGILVMVGFCLGLYFLARTVTPNQRNIKKIYHLFKRDRNRYHAFYIDKSTSRGRHLNDRN